MKSDNVATRASQATKTSPVEKSNKSTASEMSKNLPFSFDDIEFFENLGELSRFEWKSNEFSNSKLEIGFSFNYDSISDRFKEMLESKIAQIHLRLSCNGQQKLPENCEILFNSNNVGKDRMINVRNKTINVTDSVKHLVNTIHVDVKCDKK